MKYNKLIAIAIICLLSIACSTTKYISKRPVDAMDEISLILSKNYPQLFEYYYEGVLDVISVKELTLEDGTIDYDIRYRFVRYYYRNYSEMMEVLKNKFPELYQMYITGVIDVTGIYKYVDKDSGIIRNHVSYRRIYDFYYEPTVIPYNHTRLYYRPRPLPLPRYQPVPPPPKPQPNPRPERNHNDRGSHSNRGGRR